MSSVGNMAGMFTGATALSNENYSLFLISLSQQNLRSNVQLDAEASYCDATARQEIIDNFGWNIQDAGIVEDCDLNLSSQNLVNPVYSIYQQSLYEKITSLRLRGMNYVQIANWLNKKGYKTPRGRSFRNNHVHSIVKKRRTHLDILQTAPKQSLSNIRLRYNKVKFGNF